MNVLVVAPDPKSNWFDLVRALKYQNFYFLDSTQPHLGEELARVLTTIPGVNVIFSHQGLPPPESILVPFDHQGTYGQRYVYVVEVPSQKRIEALKLLSETSRVHGPLVASTLVSSNQTVILFGEVHQVSEKKKYGPVIDQYLQNRFIHGKRVCKIFRREEHRNLGAHCAT